MMQFGTAKAVPQTLWKSNFGTATALKVKKKNAKSVGREGGGVGESQIAKISIT